MSQICAVCGERRSYSESDPHGMFGYHKYTPREAPVAEVAPTPPEPPLRDAALRAGVFQYVEKRAGELKNQAREELRALPFGDSIAGKANDQVLCKASWVKGRQKIVVTDEAALLAWVKEHHPTEVVESVNPAFMKTFGTVDDQVHWQGEPVDFMKAEQGQPYVTVKGNDETPFLIAQLMKAGLVSIDGIKEISE